MMPTEAPQQVDEKGTNALRTLSVPLGELDLDLTPANPFMVQVV